MLVKSKRTLHRISLLIEAFGPIFLPFIIQLNILIDDLSEVSAYLFAHYSQFVSCLWAWIVLGEYDSNTLAYDAHV
jgi:hypothetical protein